MEKDGIYLGLSGKKLEEKDSIGVLPEIGVDALQALGEGRMYRGKIVRGIKGAITAKNGAKLKRWYIALEGKAVVMTMFDIEDDTKVGEEVDVRFAGTYVSGNGTVYPTFDVLEK